VAWIDLKAVAWVLNLSPPQVKALLVMLCNADENGVVKMSLNQIAEAAEVHRESVRKLIAKLRGGDRVRTQRGTQHERTIYFVDWGHYATTGEVRDTTSVQSGTQPLKAPSSPPPRLSPQTPLSDSPPPLTPPNTQESISRRSDHSRDPDTGVLFPELEPVPVPEAAPGGRVDSRKKLPRGRLAELQKWFGGLYKHYPRHDAKQPAWQAFVKLGPDFETCREMAKDIDNRLRTGEWDPNEKSKICLFSTYLNQRRWVR
jgi:hypothetical protein